MPVAKTSLESFTKNKEDLDTLKELTLYELKKFRRNHGFCPTYNELHKFMIRRNQEITWRTQIQPRLTSELVDEGKVQESEIRECIVSGENIKTWRPTA